VSLVRAGVVAATLALGAACGAPLGESPCAAGPRFARWEPRRAPHDDGGTDDGGDSRGAADGLIAWYQRALRRPELPGTGCPFYPSCSAFARQALDRWGVLGFVLIADRLFVREHPLAGASYPVHCDEQRALWDDPVP
jgi:putative component of membrane protein insertase Oxa1/YidC/SpoIIIJ protein YidD